MISNEIEIEIRKNALLEPILLDYLNNYIEWDEAVSSLDAIATWGDSTQVSTLGSFIIRANNATYFSPSNVGEASINLFINYRENNELKQVQQNIKIKVVNNTAAEINVSNTDQ